MKINNQKTDQDRFDCTVTKPECLLFLFECHRSTIPGVQNNLGARCIRKRNVRLHPQRLLRGVVVARQIIDVVVIVYCAVLDRVVTHALLVLSEGQHFTFV